MRTDWTRSDDCNHLFTVCLDCCSPAERDALDADLATLDLGASAPISGPRVGLLPFRAPSRAAA